MDTLFSDPMMYLPVIVILTIFGVFYVAAMIWAYNRDAKKQGKKSGCLPVVLIFLMLSATAILLGA